jgi:polyhydroxyalkanoate synthesis regulator phasin
MGTFIASPFSVPVLIVGIVVISSMITKIAKMRYSSMENSTKADDTYRREIDELRRRVENLESIVIDLERKNK